MNFNLFGRKVSVTMQPLEYKDILKASTEELLEYKSASMNQKQKAADYEKWFKALHWEFFRKENVPDMPEPTTNYLLSNIQSKHADFMDAFPKPNLLPRERDDEGLAETLTSIIPVILKRNKYKRTYSKAMYTKLKQGYCFKAVLWDQDTNNGHGDVKLTELDVTKVFTEPGITDIQDSASIYVVDLVDNDKLRAIYANKPEVVAHIGSQKLININEYPQIDYTDTTNKTLVVDRYYKKEGQLHYFKFIEGAPIFWSEDPKHEEQEINPEMGMPYPNPYAQGFYNHGSYPITVDVLIPEPGTIYGIGLIDIMKNPQMYIDKFDQIMQSNMLRASKNRYFVKKNGSVNTEQFLDLSNDLIECEGNVGEDSIREAITKQIDPNVIEYRRDKINELKEIASTNEFSRGEGGSGVTAYRAIAVLQEAANKISRDMISYTYETYSEEIELVAELIKQFYTLPRMFRITNDEGVFEYKGISSANLADKQDPQLNTTAPIKFDIDIVPEKDDPFSSAANNELMMELYKLGFFNPEMAQQSLIALENMDIDGKEKIRSLIKENALIFQQVQQAQVAMQENQMLKAMVQKLTGEDLGVPTEQGGMNNDQGNSIRGEQAQGQ